MIVMDPMDPDIEEKFSQGGDWNSLYGILYE